MRTPTASSNPINRGRTLPTAVHPPTIRVLGVHPLGCSRLRLPHPPFAPGQIRDTCGHIIPTPKSSLTPPAKELGPKTHKIAFLKRTDNHCSKGIPSTSRPPANSKIEIRNLKPRATLPSRMLTFPSQVTAITNSNPYSCNTCNPVSSVVEHPAALPTPSILAFHVSKSFHSRRPKNSPTQSSRPFFLPWNNGQLRPPNLTLYPLRCECPDLKTASSVTLQNVDFSVAST